MAFYENIYSISIGKYPCTLNEIMQNIENEQTDFPQGRERDFYQPCSLLTFYAILSLSEHFTSLYNGSISIIKKCLTSLDL